jgi:hypothetical protein
MDLNSHIMAIGSEHSGIRGASILLNSPSVQMFRAAIASDPSLRQEVQVMLDSTVNVPTERCVVTGKIREILHAGLANGG